MTTVIQHFRSSALYVWKSIGEGLGSMMGSSQADSSQQVIKSMKLQRTIVIGSSFGGKSYLLEAIARLEIFARDGRLETKCPISLQLSCSPIERIVVSWQGNETVCPDSATLSDKVREITKSLKTMTNTPIYVKVSGPNLVDLEIVDLPGKIILTSIHYYSIQLS
jgi:hypothetical protein